jgi:hypothetical protein
MSRTQRVGSALSRRNKVGLVLAGVLGLIDLTNLFTIPAESTDTPGPPVGVLVAGCVLGVITIVAVVHAWRTADRTGSRVAAGSRILSAVTALPALFVTGVPAWTVVVVAVYVVVTVVVIALILSLPAAPDRPGTPAVPAAGDRTTALDQRNGT